MRTLVAVGYSNLSEEQTGIPYVLLPSIDERIRKKLSGIEVPQFPGGFVFYSYFERELTGRQPITLRTLRKNTALLIRLDVVATNPEIDIEELLVVFCELWEKMVTRLAKYLQRKRVAPELVASVVEGLRLPPPSATSAHALSSVHTE